MNAEALHQRLAQLHAQGDSQGILREVEASGPALEKHEPSATVGSIYRYAMLAEYRRREYEAGDVWWERAMDQFVAAGYVKGIAVLLITPAFRSLDLIPQHEAMESVAHMVMRGLEGIITATSDDHAKSADDDPFAGETMLRIVYEKMGYRYFRTQKYAAALESYRKALGFVSAGEPGQTPQLRRDELKVRGGAALARYFIDPDTARAELEVIERQSREGELLQSIHACTVQNLECIDRGDVKDPNHHCLCHYDIR